jgi:hypothetical protein
VIEVPVSVKGVIHLAPAPPRVPPTAFGSPPNASVLLPPREVSSLTLELIHGDSWESRSSVALSLILVDFVDGTVV